MTSANEKVETANTSGSAGIGTIDRLSEQVKFGHQAWMERLRVMQEVETAFAKELLATRDPNEALRVCNRWIAKRLELLAADSKDFTGFWMDLVMTAAGGPRPPGLGIEKKGEES
jgi:hypothetical protein